MGVGPARGRRALVAAAAEDKGNPEATRVRLVTSVRRARQHDEGGDDAHDAEEVTMPSWTAKDRRQYEHIKAGYQESGTPEERAEEIAARTVNKERREEGRTPNERSQGTGNPRQALEARSKVELENRARELRVRGRSKMSKAELVEAIRERE